MTPPKSEASFEGTHVKQHKSVSNGVLDAHGILPVYLPDTSDEPNDAELSIPRNGKTLSVRVPDVDEPLQIVVLKEGVTLKQNATGAFDIFAASVEDVQQVAQENVRKIYQSFSDHVKAQIDLAEKEAYSFLDTNPDLVAGALVDSSLVLFPGFVTTSLLATGDLNGERKIADESSPDADFQVGCASLYRLLADIKAIVAGGAGLTTLQSIKATAVKLTQVDQADLTSALTNMGLEEDRTSEEEQWSSDDDGEPSKKWQHGHDDLSRTTYFHYENYAEEEDGNRKSASEYGVWNSD